MGYVRDYPDVKLQIVEGYSAVLTDMVLAEELDFAVVPTFEGRVGLKSRLLARDREMLISGRARGLTALSPVRLADCVPLKIVVPGTHNIRRRNLETYFQTNGIPIEDRIEMDAMIGTLEFVARSEWVAVLPSIICINDVGRGDLVVNPIVDPPLFAEFVVIAPARRPLGGEARRFLDRIEGEIAKIRASWKEKFRARARKNLTEKPARGLRS
jgi:LysR family transcriptional regulator, nitrogen assimilation regulatory protein